MDDKSLSNLTLSGWAAAVWSKELRGVPLQPQEAALAWCMRQHSEYRAFWNSLGGAIDDTPRAKNILVHIYNDGAVKLQLDANNPPEIFQCYQEMRSKGFADIVALHVIAHVLQEQTWNSNTTGEAFDVNRYIERTRQYVASVIQHPEFVLNLRTP